MQDKPNDILLVAGKVMTIILQSVTAIVAVIMIGMIPGLLIFQADFAQAVVDSGGGNVGTALAASIALLLIGAAITAMAFHFFQLLGRIIDSVSKEDPFNIANSERLNRMGWIALIFQLAAFPIAALVIYLDNLIPLESLEVDFEFTLTGLLMAIVLFILARVFKHGAAMRDDLEGTV